MKSINPATGEEIATHEEMTQAQIDAALDRAEATFAIWRDTPIEDRTALLTALADAYHDNRHRLARMATLEMGKTLKSALAEVDKCVAAFRHYAKEGPAMLEGGSITLSSGGKADLVWLPIGAVLAVMPLHPGGQCRAAQTCEQCAGRRRADAGDDGRCGRT